MHPDALLRVAQVPGQDTSQQQGFWVANSRGVRVGIVVDRFLGGWCCWGVLPGGCAFRFPLPGEGR